MLRPRGQARRPALLPAGFGEFLRRRLREGLGILLFAAALLLAATLASYHPEDPSWNSAAPGPVANWLGRSGAVLADLAVQWLGLAALLPILLFAAWGWRLASQQGLPRLPLNLVMAPLAMLSAAVLAALLPDFTLWPFETGPGGVLGALALRLASLGALSEFAVAVTALAVALASLPLALGISGREWARAGHAMAGGLLTLLAGLRLLARATVALRQRLARLRRRASPPALAMSLPQPAEPAPTAEDPAAERLQVHKRESVRRSRRVEADGQARLQLEEADRFALPTLRLLRQPEPRGRQRQVNAEALQQNARLLESVLDDYGVRGQINDVRPGPVVTLYELEPAPGTKTARVIGLADDIARSMSAVAVRVATVPGRSVIGIELPNQGRETVYLSELLATPEFNNPAGALTLALGKDIGGQPVMADLAKMPHLLIAGTTGSGKSVAINVMILSLVYRLPPERCRLILIDPKMLELSAYDGIPHLLAPVVTDPAKAVVALKWAVREMEGRYRAMARLGVRNIAGYNRRLQEAREAGEVLRRTVQTGFDPASGQPVYEEELLDTAPLPYIVVVVDEMADLMMVAGREIEGAIQRLAQMARAAGIHLIMATQRPSVDVITGTIKANFPTRISFQVTSKIDSRTILGEQGAEQLLGQGDMLYMVGGGRIGRVHGPFVSEREVEQVARWLRQQGEPEYLDAVTENDDDLPGGGAEGEVEAGGDNSLYDRAVDLVARHQRASTSFLQRHLQIGYNRAASLMERMEQEGAVGRANHVGKREIFVRRGDDDA
ncbi:MAG: DNA translocase FtsK [Alphaproteobacteria bacterium]|nr:DNA translocase FtsK [Alphaproteobacteria bacterium]